MFPIYIRKTSLEQLSLADFSGENARSKVYENDNKNVLGIWTDLEWEKMLCNDITLFFLIL